MYYAVMSNSSHSIAIQLPAGGALVAFNNPNPPMSDCSTVMNLQTQVAPLIALMNCQLKMVKLLKPLIDVIHGLPNPSVQAIQAFSAAAAEVAPCLVAPTPESLLPFLKDLLCLEIKGLNCFLRNLDQVTGETRGGRPLPGGSQLRAVLESYPAIISTLILAGELFQIAGLTPPQPPVLSGKTDGTSLNADRAAVEAFAASLQTAADALGGCS